MIVVCPSCGVPFTRTGAARSSGFYRTHAENDTCICCREGLDPVTLEPLATRGQPMKAAKEMSDDELGEAILELAAPRVRMAELGELRKIADVLATLAVEAAGRMKDRGRLKALLEHDAGALLGHVSDVAIDEHGTLTARLEVNDAGAAFLSRVTRGNHGC